MHVDICADMHVDISAACAVILQYCTCLRTACTKKAHYTTAHLLLSVSLTHMPHLRPAATPGPLLHHHHALLLHQAYKERLQCSVEALASGSTCAIDVGLTDDGNALSTGRVDDTKKGLVPFCLNPLSKDPPNTNHCQLLRKR